MFNVENLLSLWLLHDLFFIIVYDQCLFTIESLTTVQR